MLFNFEIVNKSLFSMFKISKNIQKVESGSYHAISDNKSSSTYKSFHFLSGDIPHSSSYETMCTFLNLFGLLEFEGRSFWVSGGCP